MAILIADMENLTVTYATDKKSLSAKVAALKAVDAPAEDDLDKLKALKCCVELFSCIQDLEHDFLEAVEMGFANVVAQLKVVNPELKLPTDGRLQNFLTFNIAFTLSHIKNHFLHSLTKTPLSQNSSLRSLSPLTRTFTFLSLHENSQSQIKIQIKTFNPLKLLSPQPKIELLGHLQSEMMNNTETEAKRRR
ncbi:hypothetical protein RYX36_003390, partial [Vicia faba]